MKPSLEKALCTADSRDGVVAHGRGDDAEPRVRSGPRQVGGEPVGRPGTQVGRVGAFGLEPDGGGDDGRLPGRHVSSEGPRG